MTCGTEDQKLPHDPTETHPYTKVLTPLACKASSSAGVANEEPNLPPVTKLVYTSVALAMLSASHLGWCLSQLNLASFHNYADCDTRLVKPGTCLMFPGHTKTEWLFVVNAWVVGGMIGALSSGHISDRLGRKRTLTVNCGTMTIGAIVQASAPSLPLFAVGRAVAGLASGTASALCNAYISEIVPPHLRNTFGSGFGFAVASAIFLLDIAFSLANTASGWRYIAGFPIVIALIFLFSSRHHMIETPSWLILKSRQEEAEQVLARLYGEEHVQTALKWILIKRANEIQQSPSSLQDDPEYQKKPRCASPWMTLLSKRYRIQVLLAIHIALATQFTRCNAVFFYSSMLFKTAGVSDGLVGNLIVGIVLMLPNLFIIRLTRRYGNRDMLLLSQGAMLIGFVRFTTGLTLQVSALSIFFIAFFVFAFTISISALAFSTGASLYRDEIRATGTSVMMVVTWMGILAIGIGFPYISTALDDLTFLPFMATIAYFIAFMYKFLPNTTGKANDEIQQLFANVTLKR